MTAEARRATLLLIPLMLVSLLLSVLRFNGTIVGSFLDDAHYIVLAEGLATGEGFNLVNYDPPVPERDFPPGWPLLLSPLSALFGSNLPASSYAPLKVFTLLFWVFTIPLVYWLFRERLPSPYLEIVVALTALQPGLTGTAVSVMSESAYIFFVLLTLCLFNLWQRHTRQPQQNPWVSDALLALVLLLALYTQLIRTVGLALVVGLLLYLLVDAVRRRRFRPLIVTAFVTGLGLLLISQFNARTSGGIVSGGYVQQVLVGDPLTKLSQIWANFEGYTVLDYIFANAIIPVFGPNLTDALQERGLLLPLILANLALLGLLLVGFILAARRFQLSELYVVIYFAAVLNFWRPFEGSLRSTQDRFIVPLVPFLYFYLILALIWLLGRVFHDNPRRVQIGTLAVATMIALVSVGRSLQDWRNPLSTRIPDITIGTSWLNENAEADAVIMTREPVADYLYARRTTLLYPRDEDIDTYLTAHEPDYILLGGAISPDTRANDALETYITRTAPEQFELVYNDEASDVRIYRILNIPEA